MKIQKKLAINFIKNKLTWLTLIDKRSGGREAFRLFCTPFARYGGKEAGVFANGKSLQFKLNDILIKGYECNASGTKTVLLLQGFSSSIHKFDKYAEALIAGNYRVLAFDAPAHGFSGGKMVNALDYREMIITIAKNYGPVDAFIAHSFGGIAVSLALEKMPHNGLTKVVLIAPATETTSAVDGALKMLNIQHPKVKEALNEHIYKVGNQPVEWYSIRRAMNNIKAQVMWIHDEDDDITPLADALKVKEDAHSNIQFIITKGLGHQRIYKDAGVRQQITDFLNR